MSWFPLRVLSVCIVCLKRHHELTWLWDAQCWKRERETKRQTDRQTDRQRKRFCLFDISSVPVSVLPDSFGTGSEGCRRRVVLENLLSTWM